MLIHLNISKKKPKPPAPVFPGPQSQYSHNNSYTYSVGSTSKVADENYWEKAKQRDKIIKDLLKDCPYKVGDVCVPKNPKEEEKYGDLTVQAICDSYAKFGVYEQWPENNNPMLISCISSKTQGVVWTTVNYLKKK